jgi:predicted XRE-type DNA-binding protein
MPFVLVAPAHSLEYMRSYGFKTFDSVWDESYDSEIDDDKRLVMIADLLKQLDSMSTQQRQDLYTAAMPIVQHNYNHFYNGAFESTLWTELTAMIDRIVKDFDA